MSPLHVIGYAAAAVYGIAVFALLLYALHGLWLLWHFRRGYRQHSAAEQAEENEALPPDAELPLVLVQLPVFNERDVVARIIDAAVALDWPRDRLEIQLLDDSTDDSVNIAAALVDQQRQAGVPIVHVHRTDRTGFKAGALEAGMAASEAEYIAIFDADFVPRPDFLKRAIKPFLKDDQLALVQGRWEHHNRRHNMLTKLQAIGIDGHFAVEQSARAWSGIAMNFNGTCGMWRRSAIDDSGGWEHESLTEDLDLSYRAQLKGWRCTYRIGLDVPGELPAHINAWRSQQFRWAKGSQQTARKLWPRIRQSNWSLGHKLAALLHLTHYAVHPFMLLSLLAAPIALWLCPTPPMPLLMAGLAAFLIGVFSPIATYIVSQFTLHGRGAWRNLRLLPALASMGTGIAVSNAAAVYEAWTGVDSPFVRTPKQGEKVTSSYKAGAKTGVPELLCAAWAAVGIGLSISSERYWVAPLLLIYTSGFVWVGFLLLQAWLSQRAAQVSTGTKRNVLTAGLLTLCGIVTSLCYFKLGNHYSTWQFEPWTFAGAGLLAGALYLLASWRVIRAPGRGLTLGMVVAFGLLFRFGIFGLAPSDDLNRYIVEGRQWAYGQNPYIVAPHDIESQELLRPVLDNTIIDGVNHPTWTAIYPPLTIHLEMLITHIDSRVSTMNFAAMVAEIVAMLFVLALLIDRRIATSWWLLAWWNPVAIIWFAGEGHNDSFMVMFLAASLWLANRAHQKRSLIATSLACLCKPFAGWILLAQLHQHGWRRIWLPALIAIIGYAPFLAAGTDVLSSLGRFGGEKHFHGALEPLFRYAFIDWVPSGALRPLVVTCLAAVLLAGTFAVVRNHRRQAKADDLQLYGRLFGLLLLCLPTLHPWYLLPLVIFLPLMPRSPGFLVWTAMAPMYWLHGLAILDNNGAWAEDKLVTMLAHAPALLLLVWECTGRPGLLDAVTTESAQSEPAMATT